MSKPLSKNKSKALNHKKKRKPVPRAPRHIRTPIHDWIQSRKMKYLKDFVMLSHPSMDRKSKSGLRHEGSYPDIGTGVRVSDVVHLKPTEEEIQMAGSFVSLNTVYRFRLGGYATIGYAAGPGPLNTYIKCDPSSNGVNFPEYADLQALFSEMRLVTFKVTFAYQSEASNADGDYVNPILIAGNLGTAGAPGSYAVVADNADSRIWSGRHGVSAHTHSINGTGVGWSVVGTPSVVPYSGAPGSIQIYGDGNETQTNVIGVLIEGIYEFRSRV